MSAAGCIEHLSGEMLGSRQRRLHRSDKFQLSLRQRDCTSIRETKLFPFHGKKRERERGERASLVKERSCIVLAIQPTRLPFYHSSDVVSRSASSLRLTTDGIQGSRHVSRRSSPGFNYSVRKWSVYSLISPVTNHVNRWERTSFVWRCSFTRIPTTMLDGERGRERGRALKTTLAVTKLERICTIYLRTG